VKSGAHEIQDTDVAAASRLKFQSHDPRRRFVSQQARRMGPRHGTQAVEKRDRNRNRGNCVLISSGNAAEYR